MKKETCTHGEEHEARAIRAKENRLSEEELARLSDTFRILGEPSRLRIVLALLEGETCVYHIVESCGGTQSGVSHQLRVLKDNRVVKARREGQNVLYSVADQHVVDILGLSLKHLKCEEA